jgi:hypothetical protein
MRWLPGVLLSELLALLLMVTSPAGTGEGVHHDQLLDVLFPHVHFVDGRVVAADTALPVIEQSFGSPALGAGAGASAAGAGASVMPPTPLIVLLPPIQVARRPAATNEVLPLGHLEAPPDPPPTSATA